MQQQQQQQQQYHQQLQQYSAHQEQLKIRQKEGYRKQQEEVQEAIKKQLAKGGMAQEGRDQNNARKRMGEEEEAVKKRKSNEEKGEKQQQQQQQENSNPKRRKRWDQKKVESSSNNNDDYNAAVRSDAPTGETSKRQGVSNLPAWMTKGDKVVSAVKLSPKSGSSNRDTDALDSSKRRGVSNLPAWMTKGTAMVGRSLSPAGDGGGDGSGGMSGGRGPLRATDDNGSYGDSRRRGKVVDGEGYSGKKNGKKNTKRKRGDDYDTSEYSGASDAKMLMVRADRFKSTPARKGSPSTSGETATASYASFMGAGVINAQGVTKQNLTAEDYSKMTVKGTCEVKEKEYLRLTAPPKPEQVRTLRTLRKHHSDLTAKIRDGNFDYTWICSQYKAIRQDLTVQRINNELTVKVYETHARVALEMKDLNEFNQCQTQLMRLYDEHIAKGPCMKEVKNRNEFLSYRILYSIILQSNKKYEGGSTDMLNLLEELTPEDEVEVRFDCLLIFYVPVPACAKFQFCSCSLKPRRIFPRLTSSRLSSRLVSALRTLRQGAVSHALKVRVAMAEHDYNTFFKLYLTSPNMSVELMDYIVPSMRFYALQAMCKAYKPSLQAEYCMNQMGFYATNGNDLEQTSAEEEFESGKKYLVSCGCLMEEDASGDLAINTRGSVLVMPDTGQISSLQ